MKQVLTVAALASLAFCSVTIEARQSRGEQSDIQTSPSTSDSAELGGSCFPLLVGAVSARVDVYESVRGEHFGDLPTRRPLPQLRASLEHKLASAFPRWL